MQPQTADHDDFPHSTAWTEGIRVVESQRDGRNVHVHLNVPFAQKSGRTLRLHVIQPSIDVTYSSWESLAAERFPCIAFIQGSAWGEQQMGSSMAFWNRFALRGYVIALIEHRPSDIATFPAQVEDAKTALRWLAANPDQFGIDPARMVLSGDSSGGHTTLMVHVTQHLPELDDEPDVPLDIKAFIDFYGPTDLARLNDEPCTMDQLGPDSPAGRLLGGVDTRHVPELTQRANPGHWIDPGRDLAPLLMVHGSKDRLIPFAQSVYHYDALRAAGQPVELVQVRDAGHGWPALYTEEVADIVDQFVRDSLSGDGPIFR